MKKLEELEREKQIPALMAEWKAYRLAVYAGELNQAQEDECRRAFFGGLSAGVNAFMAASEYPEKFAVYLMHQVSEQLALVPSLEFPEVIPPQFKQKGGH